MNESTDNYMRIKIHVWSKNIHMTYEPKTSINENMIDFAKRYTYMHHKDLLFGKSQFSFAINMYASSLQTLVHFKQLRH